MAVVSTQAETVDAGHVQRRRGRRTMLAILAVCAAPIVLGTIAYFFWQPAGRTNFGELLPPKPFAMAATELDGRPFDPKQFGGKWVLVVLDRPSCDEACQRKLFLIRQIRTAHGRDQSRVERLWLLRRDGDVAATLQPLTTGATLARIAIEEDPSRLLGATPERFVFLVDPQGNLMMRFAADAEPKLIMKDLGKLLRINNRGS